MLRDKVKVKLEVKLLDKEVNKVNKVILICWRDLKLGSCTLIIIILDHLDISIIYPVPIAKEKWLTVQTISPNTNKKKYIIWKLKATIYWNLSVNNKKKVKIELIYLDRLPILRHLSRLSNNLKNLNQLRRKLWNKVKEHSRLQIKMERCLKFQVYLFKKKLLHQQQHNKKNYQPSNLNSWVLPIK
jgi:hypothetical protein